MKMSFGTDPIKLVRSDGIDTSFEAAYKIDTTYLESLVYFAIKGYGDIGCISDQLINMFPLYPYSSITARYKSLLDKGFIEDTGERRNGRSGRKQRVMRANQAPKKQLHTKIELESDNETIFSDNLPISQQVVSDQKGIF